MEGFNVTLLGATGAVGQEMLNILEERNFPVKNLKLLSSAKSKGKKIVFKNKEYEVEEAVPSSFKDSQIILGAAGGSISKRFINDIKAGGGVFIDNSSAFRLESDVPLVVPEINGSDIKKQHKVIANPNCSTIITLMAVNPINLLYPVEAMVVSTYQAVSGAGAGGLTELEEQMKSSVNGLPIERKVFPYQIEANLIPQIGSFLDNGYTEEEMKLQNESRKILHNGDLKVSCTCVRVPVMRSHSISANIFCSERPDLEKVREAVSTAKGVKLTDDPKNLIYPMPLDTSCQDIVFVGRIRRDLINENGLSLFCCGDQIRKGAASNAVQIAEIASKFF